MCQAYRYRQCIKLMQTVIIIFKTRAQVLTDVTKLLHIMLSTFSQMLNAEGGAAFLGRQLVILWHKRLHMPFIMHLLLLSHASTNAPAMESARKEDNLVQTSPAIAPAVIMGRLVNRRRRRATLQNRKDAAVKTKQSVETL